MKFKDNHSQTGLLRLLILGSVLITLCFITLIIALSLDYPEDDRPIGFEFLDSSGDVVSQAQGEVVHIWNTQDDYYFNKSSGIQFSNYFDDYWTHNVFCAGYKHPVNGWTYKCNDALPFTWNIITDGKTYINITGYNDTEILSRTVKLGLRYHLKLNDKNLSIQPNIKLLAGNNITVPVGFAWVTNNISVDGDAVGDSIFLNDTSVDIPDENDTNSQFNLSSITETLRFKDMEESYYMLIDRSHVRLDWNNNLNYVVEINKTDTYDNARVTLAINAGPLNLSERKATTLYWKDPVVFGNNNSGDTAHLWDISMVWNHTITCADDQILIVGIAIDSEPTVRVSQINYDGIALSRINITDSGDSEATAEMWNLTNPPCGGRRIVNVTFTGDSSEEAAGVSVVYNNVKMINISSLTVGGSINTDKGTGITVPAAATQWVVDVLAYDNDPITGVQGDNQTIRGVWDQDVISVGISDGNDSDGSVNMSWVIPGDEWAQIGVAMVPITYGALNVNLTSPADDVTVAKGSVFYLNATVECIGEVGSTCGTVYAYARYNDTTAIPDTVINLSSGTPFYVPGWNLSTATYNQVNLSSSIDLTFGFTMSLDGTKYYEAGYGNKEALQYTLYVPWDLSTATYDGVKLALAGFTSTDLLFKPDGTKLYEVGSSYRIIFPYTCSDAWNISSCVYDGFNYTMIDDDPSGIWFKPDGTKLYEMGFTNDTIFQSTLSDPWNLSTATYDNVNISTQDSVPLDLVFNPIGTQLFEMGDGANKTYQYTCTSAWDLSSCSYDNIFLNHQDDDPYGLHISPDGTKLYEMGQVEFVYEHDLEGANPKTTTLDQGESLNISWEVNASGAGVYEIGVFVNSSYGSSNVPENHTTNSTVNIDAIIPLISIMYPTNATYIINVTDLNYSASDINIDSCWYSLDGGTINSSRQVCGTNWTGLSSTEGSNIWTIYVNDTSHNSNSTNIVFFKDSIIPVLSVVHPTNGTSYSYSSVDVNFTISDANIQTCWYSNDTGATNTTVTCGNNLTANNWNEGVTTVYLYANDTAGNVNNSEYVSFIIDSYGALNVNITNPVNITELVQYNTFFMNATVDCIGDSGQTCGIVYAYARYNDTAATPSALINVTDGASPFYIIGGSGSLAYWRPEKWTLLDGYVGGWGIQAAYDNDYDDNSTSAAIETMWDTTIVYTFNLPNEGDNFNVVHRTFLIDQGDVSNPTAYISIYNFTSSSYDVLYRITSVIPETHTNYSSSDWINSTDGQVKIRYEEEEFQFDYDSHLLDVYLTTQGNTYDYRGITNPSLTNNATYGNACGTAWCSGEEFSSDTYNWINQTDMLTSLNASVAEFFNIKIDEHISSISSITFRYEGNGTVHVWNDTKYSIIPPTSYDELPGVLAIHALEVGDSISDYVGSDGYIHIKANDTDNNISTDYVSVNVYSIGNPQSQSLEQGEQWNVSWILNVTTASTESYLIDVLFNSSYGSSIIANNSTANRTVLLNTAAGGSVYIRNVTEVFSISQSTGSTSASTRSIIEILGIDQAINRASEILKNPIQIFKFNQVTSRFITFPVNVVQLIDTSQVVVRLTTLFRTPTQILNMKQVVNRVNEIFKSPIQIINTKQVVSRFITFPKNIYQILNTKQVVSRFITFPKNIYQILNTKQVVSRFITFPKNIYQILNTKQVVSRTMNIFRNPLQIINLRITAARIVVGETLKNIFQIFNFNFAATRTGSTFKTPTLVLNVKGLANKMTGNFKNVFQQLGIIQSLNRASANIRNVYQIINVNTVTERTGSFFRSVSEVINFIFEVFGIPVTIPSGDTGGGGSGTGTTKVNLSIEIEPPNDWYFNNINKLKFLTYDGEYNVNISEIKIDYYNISGISINELEVEEIETGVYIQEFMVYDLEGVNEKEIAVEVIVTKGTKIAKDMVAVTIYQPSKIKQKWMNFKKALVDDVDYILYILLFVIAILVIVLFFVLYNNIKKKQPTK